MEWTKIWGEGPFTKEGSVTLNGCNTGFYIAPLLSKLWEVPASGTLTGALFERLQADDHWYKKPDRTSSEAVASNRVNFESAQSCAKGTCWRLKAERHNYASYWGHFKEGGLSFPKFFCGFADKEKCLTNMATSLLSMPSVNLNSLSVSKEDYQAKVFDQLCSTALDPEYFETCREGILKAVADGSRVFQIHPGTALACDFDSCAAEVVCESDSSTSDGKKPGSCHLKVKANPQSTTLVDEYLSYMKGFELLKKAQ